MAVDLQITSLALESLAEAARVQGRAFFDDPAFVFTFPDEEARRDRLPWLMQVGVTYGTRFGEVMTTSGPMLGHAVWLPPGETSLSPERMGEAGFSEASQRMSAEELSRFEAFIETMTEAHEQIVRTPHWYLMILGVDPPHQGQGIGGALIAPVLARADIGRFPCYLETANERNLAFYRRHGFEVQQENDVPGGGPHIWMMLREPR